MSKEQIDASVIQFFHDVNAVKSFGPDGRMLTSVRVDEPIIEEKTTENHFQFVEDEILENTDLD